MTTITMEEYELMKDSKYRMYVAAVDKALKSFEYTSEWADLISALGKLNKVLLGYTKFPVIPRRIKISKRLAQCMHPALPSGVHLRALETYDIIFKSMGTNRLSNELFIYSAGLFPLLGHAAMNIRPALLLVYETHFVPLEERLRPALSGFLSGILPGLEIGSDHFERTNSLLENVCKGVGPDWFYTCVWQCVRTNSPVRLPAISYILAHYSRKMSMEDQLYLMGNDIDVMVSGLCAAVQDSSVLVQRSALDLLLVCFPMQNTQLLYADMVRLVTASLTTILRRDMSLNRRLYAWLLGSDISSTTNQSNDLATPEILDTVNTSPFDTTGSPTVAFDLLTEAIRTTLKQSSAEPVMDVKPYRLLTSLFEKPQIGPLILDVILYDVFRALYHVCLNQQKKRSSLAIRCVAFNGNLTSLKSSQLLMKEFVSRHCQELIKNANLLFNTLQSYYIWSYIAKLYEKAAIGKDKCNGVESNDNLNINEIGSGSPDMLEICLLADFLLDIIPLETFIENTSEILPKLFMRIILVLKNNISNLNRYEITHSLTLCMKIVTKIQPGIMKVQSQVDPDTSVEDCVLNISIQEPEKVEAKSGLEKSKSDSKLNDKLNKNELTITTSARERSNSNQMLKKKEQKSPKIEKRAKNKKSKSSSKLDELKKEDSVSLENEIEDLKIETTSVEKTVDSVIMNHSVNNKIDNNNNKYIKRCLEIYEQFFVVFIESKIIPEICVETVFKKFVRDQEVLTKELENLLEKCLESNTEKVELNSLIHESRGFKASMYDIALSDYDMAMKTASNLLIEFAAFPSLLDNVSCGNTLPYWLKVLIVCACSSKSGHEIQIIAMSTLMEIFSLAKSHNHQKKTLENSNNNIVVMGILEHSHIVYIEGSTIVLEVMSRYLWELLGALSNQSDIMLCVSLLYSLHNTFETNTVVEQVIGQYLVDENLTTEYIKRFYMLWHLGRDLNITLSNNAHIKNFDRSLLKILDNLQNPERSNIRLLSETFLTHSLLRNDIARIINPILQKLLAPSTARISIRHVHIQDTESTTELSLQDQQAMDDAQAKQIYAISSENGNVRYHVTAKTGQSPKPKKRWYLLSKAGRKYTQVVNMTTSLTENLNIVTKGNKKFNIDLLPNLEQPQTTSKPTVKLFINPLSSKEIYPDGVDGSYTKIDPHKSITSNESISSNEESSEMENQITDNKSVLSANESRLQFLERIEPITNGIKDRPAALWKSQSFDEKRAKADMENSLYHSWSYCISESDNVNINTELELSTSAEEFFQNSENVVSEILNEILYKVCGSTENELDNDLCDGDMHASRDVESNLPKLNERHMKNFTLFPMHCHLCLYYEVFDSYQILYSLKTLKSCLISNPHLFIRCLATTGLKDMKSNELLNLLARHRKSLLGSGFSGEINQDYHNFYRGYMFLDIILLVCLNYARSFYPMIDDMKLTKEEINNNQQIQLDSLEILDIIIKYLVGIVNDNAKGFGKYIADMLVKCKLQKVLLHCLLTSVRKIEDELTFAEEVLLFNGFRLYDQHKRVSEYVEAYQIQLLRLIHSVVILEYHVFPASEQEELVTEHLYTPTIPIPKQEMFLSAVVSALRHQNMKHLHQNWCNMVTSCLPYFQDNLKNICLRVIFHICNNVERIADTYKYEQVSGELCPDYATTQLESLSILVHYCLLDASQTANPNLPFNGNNGTGSASTIAGSITNNGEIFSNLVNAFFSPIGGEINLGNKQNTENYQQARKMVLSHMPRIISSVAKLWQTIVAIEGEFHSIFGNCKMVKQQLLEFLSPIAVHHGSSFLAAVAVAWNDRRNPFSTVKTILPEPNESQKNMVYLISAIRVIPLDNLVQTVIAVIKNPPPTEGLSADVCLDVSVLELFYCYSLNISETQLGEAWSSLMTLVREGCSLAPAAQFLLVALLHELLIKCSPMEERKDQKDLQDVTAKLIESVSQVCGSCLEQTTWLRRNLAVKEQDDDSLSRFSSISTTNSETLSSVNSVQAQLVLSEILAPILDICYGSSEKDKVNTILTSLMYNIVPYLKTHTNKNMPSFSACSKLLSSLSSYQYTRKAWRKDVFDLLLDNSLFQMDHSCLRYWKVIIDNLMTHDNTTFKDLMARVSMTQSGGLSIFSSREQEYEQRAQLLKRLAFVILCSEIDQYAKYMPEIQEQLTTSLRISVPGIQAQVFLCFRVLLLRMSPIQMTSLWPIIISEMLQVFIQIEQELTTDSEEFSAHIKLLSGLDASWATNSNNGLHALGHPHWLRLQLAACKLLDLALLLPATSLPQFQMYRWAFVGDDLSYNNRKRHTSHKSTSFMPHITRIASLMDEKYSDSVLDIMSIRHNELLLTMNSISQLKELRGFFKTLSLCSNRHRTECNGSMNNEYVILDRYIADRRLAAVLDKLDKVVELDFLDKIPR